MSNLTDPESLFALLRRRDDGRLDERLGRGRVQECSAVEEWQMTRRSQHEVLPRTAASVIIPQVHKRKRSGSQEQVIDRSHQDDLLRLPVQL